MISISPSQMRRKKKHSVPLATFWSLLKYGHETYHAKKESMKVSSGRTKYWPKKYPRKGSVNIIYGPVVNIGQHGQKKDAKAATI